MKLTRLCCLFGIIAAIRPAAGEGLASCLTRNEGETVQSAVMSTRPAAEELLARLAYAEGRSTGFPDDPLVYQAIAWGVMNRVRLADASTTMRRRYGSGLSGVIFRKGQFNPAVSPRSPFSKDFLCPQHPGRWQTALDAARRALAGADNPLIESSWEKAYGLSLVVGFYYPHSSQARGPLAPWEGSSALEFTGDISIGGAVLSAERIRFYRLPHPPSDIMRHASEVEH